MFDDPYQIFVFCAGMKKGFLFKKKKVDNIYNSRFFILDTKNISYFKKITVSHIQYYYTVCQNLIWCRKYCKIFHFKQEVQESYPVDGTLYYFATFLTIHTIAHIIICYHGSVLKTSCMLFYLTKIFLKLKIHFRGQPCLVLAIRLSTIISPIAKQLIHLIDSN